MDFKNYKRELFDKIINKEVLTRKKALESLHNGKSIVIVHVSDLNLGVYGIDILANVHQTGKYYNYSGIYADGIKKSNLSGLKDIVATCNFYSKGKIVLLDDFYA